MNTILGVFTILVAIGLAVFIVRTMISTKKYTTPEYTGTGSGGDNTSGTGDRVDPRNQEPQ